ncbi:MAG: DUF2069 domain-containing protein [Pseudomonadota bacterium]
MKRASRSAATLALCWGAWLLLFLQQLIDAWQLAMPWIIWVGKLLPLLIFVPGMLKDNLRSFIWLCFVSLLYFIALVERLFVMPDSPLAVTGMIAVVTLFCAAMMYVRWRGKELRLQGASQTQSGE